MIADFLKTFVAYAILVRTATVLTAVSLAALSAAVGMLLILQYSKVLRLGRHVYLLKIDPAKLQVREDIAGRSAPKGAYLVADTWSMSRILLNGAEKSRKILMGIDKKNLSAIVRYAMPDSPTNDKLNRAIGVLRELDRDGATCIVKIVYNNGGVTGLNIDRKII